MLLNKSDINLLKQGRPLTKNSGELWLVWYIVGVSVVFTTSVLTFVYGLISWKIIRKFRNFKNYVYLNAVFVNILRLLLTFVCMIIFLLNKDFYSENVIFEFVYYSIFTYLTMAYNHWLLVMSYMFYVDVVKVFQKDIKRKYLKSLLFGWVLPLVIFLVSILVFTMETREGGYEELLLGILSVWLSTACNILPIFLNLVIFVKVLWALFLYKETSAGVVTKKERWMNNCRHLSVVTGIFGLSSAVMLSSMIWQLFNFVTLWRAISLGLQIMLLAFYVPLVKCNRELWREYFANRSGRSI